MDFADRLKRNADRLRAMRPARLAPTATIRSDLDAGAWSAGEAGERLARLCAACLVALDANALPAAAYDGHKGLGDGQGAGLRVGVDGGRGWAEIAAGTGADSVAAQLVQASPRATPPGRGLELLDLSSLGVTDWRGSLVRPQVSRLVLLAPRWLPERTGPDAGARQVFGVAMDYDQRILDAARAVAFFGIIERSVREGGGG